MAPAVQHPSAARLTQEKPSLLAPEASSRFSVVTVKTLMAVTGAGLILFVTIHMLGNLQIYLGQDALNDYAKKLKSMPLLLWTARGGLLAIFSLHLGLAFYLKRINRRARPFQYVVSDPVDTTLASRTMLSSGLVIFAFVIYHLLHFTLGITDPAHHELTDAAGRHDVYSMVIYGFRNVYVSAGYLVAMIFLGLHLSHASWSIFQTFGLANQSSRRLLQRAGLALAALIMLGNMSIPISVMLGLVGLPLEGASP